MNLNDPPIGDDQGCVNPVQDDSEHANKRAEEQKRAHRQRNQGRQESERLAKGLQALHQKTDPGQRPPIFGQGDLSQASVSVNHLLGPRWSVLGSYLYTDSRNTSAGFEGNLLPGFARNVVLGQTTWRYAARSFTLLRATWRGERYRDEGNSVERPAGWSLALGHGWESSDRRWSFTGTVQSDLRSGEQPTLWALLRYRD